MARTALRYTPRSAFIADKPFSALDRRVGRQIRRYRLLCGLTQVRVAGLLGISHQQLQKYEDGSCTLHIGRLCRLADILDVPVTRLLSEEDGHDDRPSPSRRPTPQQAQLLRDVATMSSPLQQAMYRLTSALAADEANPTEPAAADDAAAMPANEPAAGAWQGPPLGAAGSAGAAAALLRARRRL